MAADKKSGRPWWANADFLVYLALIVAFGAKYNALPAGSFYALYRRMNLPVGMIANVSSKPSSGACKPTYRMPALSAVHGWLIDIPFASALCVLTATTLFST